MKQFYSKYKLLIKTVAIIIIITMVYNDISYAFVSEKKQQQIVKDTLAPASRVFSVQQKENGEIVVGQGEDEKTFSQQIIEDFQERAIFQYFKHYIGQILHRFGPHINEVSIKKHIKNKETICECLFHAP